MKLCNWLFLTVLVLAIAGLASAQQYGVGTGIGVPYVAPGTLNLDGNADETAWNDAASVDMTAHWDGEWGGHPNPDITTTTKLLWSDDTLYVFVKIEDFEPFYWGTIYDGTYRFDTVEVPWGGEQILLGIDNTHAFDTAALNWEFSGWPENAPDKGTTCYKIRNDDVTLNWGQLEFSPMDTGWVRGTIFTYEDTAYIWGCELAFYVPNAHANGQIGFNIGGANADSAWAMGQDSANYGDGAMSYYSWQSTMYPGGDVMFNPRSYATLYLEPTGNGYGVGATLDVPYVPAGALKLDGIDDEPAWLDAPLVDLTAHWDGEWGGHPNPDISAMAKLLWTDDTLYVHAKIEDFEPFYWGTLYDGTWRNDTVEVPWGGEQVLLGIDNTHAYDTAALNWDFNGWPENAPDKGTTCYKIRLDDVTLNWGQLGFSALDTGWARGTIFTYEDTAYIWGFELAIYAPNAHGNNKIGFNIGGANADSAWAMGQDSANYGDGAMSYYSWQSTMYPGGDVMFNAGSYATLHLVPNRAQSYTGGGWSLLSLPLNVTNAQKNVVYPNAISDAFKYDAGYTTMNILENGTGFWLKFPAEHDMFIDGFASAVETVAVKRGWNMIGSTSYPTPIVTITSTPGGIVTSNFFGYYNGYYVDSTINPGYGYWVKVNQAGTLILSQVNGAMIPAANTIRVIPDGDMPPPPPSGKAEIQADDPTIPKVFNLSYGYPNPFNPATRFQVDIPKASVVEVAVFDILGRRITTLLQGEHTAGTFTIEWNGRNGQSQLAPSGMYLIRMTAGNGEFTAVQKVLLMK